MKNIIAKQIKLLRQSRNLTQKQLAEKIGISKYSIINYENGLREPNTKALIALERFFGVSGSYLYGLEELEKNNEDSSNSYKVAVREDHGKGALLSALPKQSEKLKGKVKKFIDWLLCTEETAEDDREVILLQYWRELDLTEQDYILGIMAGFMLELEEINTERLVKIHRSILGGKE